MWKNWCGAMMLSGGALLAALPAQAQNVTVSPGFAEPLRASGTAGGLVDGSTFGPNCVGQVKTAPNHVITVTQAMPHLRFDVSSVDDATLIITGPNVTMCNDDAVGLAPRLEGPFAPGTYNVFVGSYYGGDFAYELQVSSTPGTGATTGTTGTAGPAIALSPGFAPDPMVLTGSAGGTTDATTLNPTCRGSIGTIPNHTFTVSAPMNFARFTAESQTDLTLVVRGPGGILCNDDTHGFNPEVAGPLAAGTYEVFVGVYGGTGGQVPYTLSVSQTPFGGGTAALPTPNSGAIQLSPGFMPDPHTVSGRSGGPVDTAGFGDSPTGPCRGRISATPNHVFAAGGSFTYLRIGVQSSVDTTLVIEGPGGVRWCQDDTDGFNPAIGRDFAAGTYNIYVGSYSTDGDYTLTLTEYQR
jgi:hypothetical protein